MWWNFVSIRPGPRLLLYEVALAILILSFGGKWKASDAIGKIVIAQYDVMFCDNDVQTMA